MKPERVDRRVKYTKMVLKESFIKLLAEKDISQISIKEICEGADINRSTFYTHYSDQYDLMKKIQDELLENVEMHLSTYMEDVTSSVTVEAVEQIFEYIKDNADLCKLLLSERGDLNFQKRVLMLVYEKNISELTRDGRMSKEDAEYVHAFTLTGSIGVIQRWLNDGLKKPPRFIAEIIVKLNTGIPMLIKK